MYPKKVNLFIPWSKAMVAGATVGSPDYGKQSSSGTRMKPSGKSTRRRKRRRRKSRMRNAKKE